MNRTEVIKSHIPSGPTSTDGCAISIENDVAVLTLTNPPMNVLSHHVRVGIQTCLKQALANAAVKAVVVTGAGRAFCAGADITEFKGGKMEVMLPDVLDTLEQSKKPVVAAINGVCMGGGFETALACHYRVCSKAAVFALPEIKLGIIPGAGGTQRLPRLIGIPDAIGIICTGRNVKAAQAQKLGIVDQVAGGNVVADAVAFARRLVAEKKPIRRLCDDTSKLGNFINNFLVFRTARQSIAKSSKGMESPLRALEAIECAAKASSFQAGMKEEQRIIIECLKSGQAAAMQHLFFSERRAQKIPGLEGQRPLPVRKAGVIGGGTMGTGIAMNFLNVGIPVTLLETNEERAKFATNTIRGNYESTMKKGRLTPEALQKRMSLLRVVVNDYPALGDADYVIEAVFENMKLKKEIFGKLSAATKPECVLATNTSTLDIDEIASASSRPHKVIGAHFFSPANVMKLLEFIRGKNTDAATIVTSMALAKTIRKTAVLAGNCFGFISNRIMLKMGLQANYMLEEGCLPTDIDTVVKGFGFPIGIFQMQDLAGVDVGYKISLETPEALRPKRTVEFGKQLFDLGRFGQKTSKGWYKYDANRTPSVDPIVTQLVLDASKKKQIKRRVFTKQEIIERYTLVMINEAANILNEGFAIRPSDVDITFIFGFGFPPYKGGPCHHADALGISNVVALIDKYHKTLGADTFPAVSPLLLRMASEGKKFADMN